MPGLAKVYYFLILGDKSMQSYVLPKDFLGDDGSVIGQIDQDYKGRAFATAQLTPSCGQEIEDIVYGREGFKNDLVEVGKTNSGESLYNLKNSDDELLKFYYGDGSNYEKSLFMGSISSLLNGFAGEKPLLIWQDPFGNYLVFLDKTYMSGAECGKPVIYLYPQTISKIKVSLDADIKVSEPEYGNGWEVTAYPDGTLINKDGQNYKYLYWEGTGKVYPEVKQGRVVETKNIEKELILDLEKLGLNQNEIKDFLEFWLSKMPKNPYTRLTWFGTSQMAALAPLTIDPKPDTLIRVFLDFGGLDELVTLEPQKLSSLKRSGFVAVEWGGLLVK